MVSWRVSQVSRIFCTSADRDINYGMIYLDFSKTLHKVPYQRLVVELKVYEVARKVLNWIKALA